MALLKNHKIIIIGFILWLFAVLSILLSPKLIFKNRKCQGCEDYSNFIRSLTIEQKANLEILELGAINVEGEFFLVGDSSEEEFDLYNNQLIDYKPISPIIDIKIERMIILNSIVKLLSPEEHDLFMNKKAVIIYRNGGYMMVYDKDAFESIK